MYTCIHEIATSRETFHRVLQPISNSTPRMFHGLCGLHHGIFKVSRYKSGQGPSSAHSTASPVDNMWFSLMKSM
jgi:hypothetical protein